MAKYCVKAVWLEDRKHLTDRIYQHGLLSISLLFDYFSCWWCDPFFTPNLNFILIVTGTTNYLTKNCPSWKLSWTLELLSRKRWHGFKDYGRVA